MSNRKSSNDSRTPPNVLILDDYPDHLRIYSLLVQQAGYASIPCLVRRAGPELDPTLAVALVLLDYRLDCEMPTSAIAGLIRQTWPGVHIILLSDIQGLPLEMEPLVTCFVQKGDPARLIATLAQLLSASNTETEKSATGRDRP